MSERELKAKRLIAQEFMSNACIELATAIGADPESVMSKAKFYTEKQFRNTRGNDIHGCLVIEYLGQKYSVNVYDAMKASKIIDKAIEAYPDEIDSSYADIDDDALRTLSSEICSDLLIGKINKKIVYKVK